MIGAMVTGLAIPTLPARDLDASVSFYARLGFQQVRRWPDYLIVRREDMELHFFAFPEVDPATTIAGCYLRVAGADTLHAQLVAAGLPRGTTGSPRLHDVAATHYGMREFAVVDPDGNLLRIGSRLAEG